LFLDYPVKPDNDRERTPDNDKARASDDDRERTPDDNIVILFTPLIPTFSLDGETVSQ